MIQRIYNTLIQYLDTNRLANLNIRTGWRRRLRDIYVAHHKETTCVTDPSNLRRQHAEKK